MGIIHKIRELKRYVFSTLRNYYLTKKYGLKGRKIRFGKRLLINNPQYISIGNETCLLDDVDLNCTYSMLKPPHLSIGDNVWIGRNSSIGCDNEVIIEDHVVTGPYVHITDRNHGFEDITLPIGKQLMTTKGTVFIGTETWIGYGAQIMSGVKIGKHCVIGAGSIVVKDVPDYCVVGGNPARILKQYNFEMQRWEKC